VRTLAALLALVGTGCSWLTVAGPPSAQMSSAPPGMTRADAPLDCTREKLAPIVDTVFASMFGAGTLVAIPGAYLVATDDDDWNRMFGVTLIGAAVVYAALAAPFYFSAKSGYRNVAACRAAHEQRGYALGAR
jgi:hypothetical protein